MNRRINPAFNPINTSSWNAFYEQVKPGKDVKPFSPVHAGTSSSHVVFVLDSSSSMQMCLESTISGFNEFLDVQKQSKVPTRVSLYTFDGNRVTPLFEMTPVEEVEPINSEVYKPHGMTNLCDAIGFTMHAVNDRLRSAPRDLRDSVQMVILTDGQENSSKFYDPAQIKSMVGHAERMNWTFMFLGANIDAFSTGSMMGFNRDNTLQYGIGATTQAFAASARMSNDLKSARSMNVAAHDAYAMSSFTDDERKNADK